MKHLVTMSVLWIGLYFSSFGQTMEEKVSIYLDSFLIENKSSISVMELMETRWTANDAMGSRYLNFNSKQKFKMESDGFQANTIRLKGTWYIHNEFIVLEVKKEKTPIYILENNKQLVLVDNNQVDILKQLLTEASYKDGELKPYSYTEIFSFLNGYTIQE